MTEPDDPVPYGLVLNLENAWRVLAALEDALLELENLAAAPGLMLPVRWCVTVFALASTV